MKTAAIAMVMVAFVAGCGKKVVKADKLLERNGLKHEVNSEESFTGVSLKYWSNGQKKWEGEYRDRKQHGKWTFWYENGQKGAEQEYRDGKQHGQWAAWYENGQKMKEGEFRDGEWISYKKWDENGNLIYEGPKSTSGE